MALCNLCGSPHIDIVLGKTINDSSCVASPPIPEGCQPLCYGCYRYQSLSRAAIIAIFFAFAIGGMVLSDANEWDWNLRVQLSPLSIAPFWLILYGVHAITQLVPFAYQLRRIRKHNPTAFRGYAAEAFLRMLGWDLVWPVVMPLRFLGLLFA